MPAPYSYDLRQKVINAIDNGMIIIKQVLYLRLVVIPSICRLHRRRETGDIRPKTGDKKGHNPKIQDL